MLKANLSGDVTQHDQGNHHTHNISFSRIVWSFALSCITDILFLTSLKEPLVRYREKIRHQIHWRTQKTVQATPDRTTSVLSNNFYISSPPLSFLLFSGSTQNSFIQVFLIIKQQNESSCLKKPSLESLQISLSADPGDRKSSKSSLRQVWFQNASQTRTLHLCTEKYAAWRFTVKLF